MMNVSFFFFQAEDGIRDIGVTGVQTCALPICEAQDAEATYTATRETSSTGYETRRETGDTEEVRVEGEPLEGDETAELRLEDDETYRDSYRDRRSEEP